MTALAIVALDGHSSLGMAAAARSGIELGAHLNAILKPALPVRDVPVGRGPGQQTSKKDLRDCVPRLEAYAAWCLGSDLVQYQKQLPRLRAIFDGASTEALRQDDERARMHIALFGPLPKETPEELRAASSRAERGLSERIQRIKRWLQEDGLVEWSRNPEFPQFDKLEGSFFALLGEDAVRLRGQLRESDVEFLYGNYSNASAMLHGSTVEAFVDTTPEGQAFPKFFTGDLSGHAEAVASEATRAGLVLELLRSHVWDL